MYLHAQVLNVNVTSQRRPFPKETVDEYRLRYYLIVFVKMFKTKYSEYLYLAVNKLNIFDYRLRYLLGKSRLLVVNHFPIIITPSYGIDYKCIHNLSLLLKPVEQV